jgi:hypothetical protein
MRVIYTLLFVLILAACSKDEQMISAPPTSSTNATKIVDADVNVDGEYILPLNPGTVRIHKQASFFAVSMVGIDSKTGVNVYRYVPAKGFTGSDEVLISETKSYTSVNPNGCNYDAEEVKAITTSYTKIRFTIK